MIHIPDVKIKTVIIFTQEFSNCLSNIERERVSIQLETISQLSLQQITIEGFIADMKVHDFEGALKKLKKVPK